MWKILTIYALEAYIYVVVLLVGVHGWLSGRKTTYGDGFLWTAFRASHIRRYSRSFLMAVASVVDLWFKGVHKL